MRGGCVVGGISGMAVIGESDWASAVDCDMSTATTAITILIDRRA